MRNSRTESEVVVDLAARSRTAELLRHFASGQIGAEEFYRSLPQTNDVAVLEIIFDVWMVDPDVQGCSRLVPESDYRIRIREQVKRYILFLKTDMPYGYPETGRVLDEGSPLHFLAFCLGVTAFLLLRLSSSSAVSTTLARLLAGATIVCVAGTFALTVTGFAQAYVQSRRDSRARAARDEQLYPFLTPSQLQYAKINCGLLGSS